MHHEHTRKAGSEKKNWHHKANSVTMLMGGKTLKWTKGERKEKMWRKAPESKLNEKSPPYCSPETMYISNHIAWTKETKANRKGKVVCCDAQVGMAPKKGLLKGYNAVLYKRNEVWIWYGSPGTCHKFKLRSGEESMHVCRVENSNKLGFEAVNQVVRAGL